MQTVQQLKTYGIQAQLNWIDAESKAEINFLWESNGSRGVFVRLSQGYNGKIYSDGTVLHAVIIQGEMNYTLPQNNQVKTLDVGSYFGATERAIHSVNSNSEKEVILYFRTNGNITVK